MMCIQDWITLIGIISASLSGIGVAFIVHFLTKRRERQNACLGLAVLLRGYNEELKKGLILIVDYAKWYALQRVKPSRKATKVMEVEIPNEYWNTFKPSSIEMAELPRLYKPKAPYYDEIQYLGLHLNRCFGYIHHNCLLLTREISAKWKNWVDNPSGQPPLGNNASNIFAGFIGGIKMTIILLEIVIPALERKAKSKRPLFMNDNKPGEYHTVRLMMKE